MFPLLSVCAMALILDMVFFGPLGLNIYGLPVRKVLIGVLIAASLIPLLTRKATDVWPIWLMIGIILFLLAWGVIIPQNNGVSLSMSVAEVQPMIAILLIFPFYFLFTEYGPRRYLKLIAWSSAIMASIVILLYILVDVFGQGSIGWAVRQFYYSLNDTDFGIYIGGLADGSYRIMLINFIIFPIMISYHCWERINLPYAALYTAATFATGTRAFLGVAALTFGVAILRKRPALAFPAILIAAYFLYEYVLKDSSLRVLDFASDFTSTSARYAQFFALMNLFDFYPIFGAGLGASASVIRSYEAPYSYELTYVALLAKLGIVGSAVVIGAILAWVRKLMRRRSMRASIVTLIAGIVLMTATNPYLINLVGMSLVAFLVALGLWWNDQLDKELAPPASMPNG